MSTLALGQLAAFPLFGDELNIGALELTPWVPLAGQVVTMVRNREEVTELHVFPDGAEESIVVPPGGVLYGWWPGPVWLYATTAAEVFVGGELQGAWN